jgi:hypothetical protein
MGDFIAEHRQRPLTPTEKGKDNFILSNFLSLSVGVFSKIMDGFI